jgi:hypothetical protein
VKARRPALGRLAAALIAASVAAGLVTILARVIGFGLDLRVLEGVTLLLAPARISRTHWRITETTESW